MYPQTLLAHFCSFLFCLAGLTHAKPLFLASVIPTINERDLIGLLVGENILPDGRATPPSTLGSLHTPTVSSIETSRLRASSVQPFVSTTPIQSLPPMAASSTTKSSIDTAFLVQTLSPVFLPEDPSNPPPSSNPITTGVSDVSATPPAELTEWKVIGVCVITVALIAILILSISFFDSWWGFLRSVICGKKGEDEGEETMVPDGERISWEFKLADEDSHRYPTVSSMESIAKKDVFL
jgi:hypothetical protein